MKTLLFKLISNKKIEIDEKVSYYIKDNYINFKIGDTLYKYDEKEDILYKNDKEISLTIDPNNNIIYVKLMENGLVFNMPIDRVKITKKEGSIRIKYAVIEGEIIENEISIEF